MQTKKSTEAPQWLLGVCHKENYSSLPLHRPFALLDGEDVWTIATDSVLLVALKGATGYGPTDYPDFDATVRKMLHPSGEWQPVDSDRFGAFFAGTQDLANKLGRIGKATINRARIYEVMYDLDWREMQVLTGEATDPVYFRGDGWILLIKPIDPTTMEPPTFETYLEEMKAGAQ